MDKPGKYELLDDFMAESSPPEVEAWVLQWVKRAYQKGYDAGRESRSAEDVYKLGVSHGMSQEQDRTLRAQKELAAVKAQLEKTLLRIIPANSAEAKLAEQAAEIDRWKDAFSELSQYIPDVYGDEKDHATRKVLAEMARKKVCWDSWHPKKALAPQVKEDKL